MHLASMQRQVFSDKHWVCRMILESGPRIVVFQTQCAQNNVAPAKWNLQDPLLRRARGIRSSNSAAIKISSHGGKRA